MMIIGKLRDYWLVLCLAQGAIASVEAPLIAGDIEAKTTGPPTLRCTPPP